MQIPPSFRATGFRWKPRWVLFATAVLCSGAGCFERIYEQRVTDAEAVYNHRDDLKRELQREWSAPKGSVRLQVPKPYAEIPAPPPPAEPKEGEAPAEGAGEAAPELPPDPRQKLLFDFDLPGLVGAWQANFTVEADHDGDGTSDGPAETPSYIFVMTNHSYFLLREDDPNWIDPMKFHEYAISLIADALAVPIPNGEWQAESFPRDNPYFAKVPLSSTTTDPILIGGVANRFSLYLYGDGDIQTMVLLVIPEGVSSLALPRERIDMSLETLKVSKDKPTVGGGPASSGPGTSF